LERPADEGLKSVLVVSVAQFAVDVIQVIVDVGELEQGEISGWHTINTRWVSFAPSTLNGQLPEMALDDHV
jgi:hypothetical protein